MSDASQGEGWWQANNGKWYPAYLYPSDRPNGEGWWQASNGKWYTPQFHPGYKAQSKNLEEVGTSSEGPTSTTAQQPAPSAGTTTHLDQTVTESDVSQGEGWWQGTNGKWYPRELYPSDTPRASDWWQATNGKWFAPQFHPNYAATETSRAGVAASTSTLTSAVTLATPGASATGQVPDTASSARGGSLGEDVPSVGSEAISPSPSPPEGSEQSETLRFCPICGTEARAGNSFCRSCGTSLRGASAVTDAGVVPPRPEA